MDLHLHLHLHLHLAVWVESRCILSMTVVSHYALIYTLYNLCSSSVQIDDDIGSLSLSFPTKDLWEIGTVIGAFG